MYKIWPSNWQLRERCPDSWDSHNMSFWSASRIFLPSRLMGSSPNWFQDQFKIDETTAHKVTRPKRDMTSIHISNAEGFHIPAEPINESSSKHWTSNRRTDPFPPDPENVQSRSPWMAHYDHYPAQDWAKHHKRWIVLKRIADFQDVWRDCNSLWISKRVNKNLLGVGIKILIPIVGNGDQNCRPWGPKLWVIHRDQFRRLAMKVGSLSPGKKSRVSQQ